MAAISGINVDQVFQQRADVIEKLRNWPKPKVEHLQNYVLPDLCKIIIAYCDTTWVCYDTVMHGRQMYVNIDNRRYFCTLRDSNKLHILDVVPTEIDGVTYDRKIVYVDKKLNGVWIKYIINNNYRIWYIIGYLNGVEVGKRISDGETIKKYTNGVYVGMT
jgi:hypothetical protein